MKPIIFISHITTESSVAIWIKKEIGGLLLGGVEFFVSSDGKDIIGGDRWLERIETSLKNSSIVLVLCSEISVRRPWINFEAGGAWMAGKRVIPLCHGGMRPDILPEPLASLHAYSLYDPSDLFKLVSVLAGSAGLETPKFDPNSLLKTVSTHMSDSASFSRFETSEARQQDPSGPIPHIETISSIESEYAFDKRTGIYRNKMTQDPFCTSCLLKGRASPLSESPEGWRCHYKGCEKFYRNPSYSPPGTADMEWDPFER